jgi:cyanate permease
MDARALSGRKSNLNARPASQPFFGWRMVALAFVAYNFGLTVVITSFGPALPILQRELGVSRAAISMAFGLQMLALGGLAAVFGNLTRWVKVRTLMLAGCVAHCVGFLLLAYARSLIEVLVVYGVLLGAASCMMATIGAPTLVSRWFEKDRGKALGLAIMQPMGLLAAPAAGWLVATGGSRLLFLCLAGMFVLVGLVLTQVIDRPEDVGQRQRRADAAQAAGGEAEAIRSSREIFLDRRFWMLSLAVCGASSCGIVFAAHGPAMAIAKGLDIKLASLTLAASGAGALVATLGFGWLADRIGPFGALLASLVLSAVSWLGFTQVDSLPLVLAFSFCLAGLMGAAISLHSACTQELFGTATFARAIGYGYFVKAPFLFVAAPLAGRLFDLSGGYGSTYAVVIAVLSACSLLAVALMFDHQRRIGPVAAPAPAS